jgi:glycosyltransferase involved in cell wall biosynthesis
MILRRGRSQETMNQDVEPNAIGPQVVNHSVGCANLRAENSRADGVPNLQYRRTFMRVAIVAPPFIPVPPIAYGGTELFVAHLAEALMDRGHTVIVYANGESRLRCEVRWLYPNSDWPPADPVAAHLRNAEHTAWAIRDAAQSTDVVHLNDVIGLPFTRFVNVPVVLTIHHTHDPVLSAMYERYPRVEYVAISEAQARREPMPRITVVHHGLRLDDYIFKDTKQGYLVFLGRMAPCKGAHAAIAVARLAGLRLKLAGEVQRMYEPYWRDEVLPLIDGDQIQYLGEADDVLKKELLSGAQALLFPIQWEEPFGLVMIEALACGTPVLAFEGGSVAEIVRDGVSGWICRDVAEMAGRARSPGIPAQSCRAWASRYFSCERMADRYLDVYRRAQVGGGRAIARETDSSWKT